MPVCIRRRRPGRRGAGLPPDVSAGTLLAEAPTRSRGRPVDRVQPRPDRADRAGIAPGNGTLVNAVGQRSGRGPDSVAGKPYRPLFDETVRRIASQRPLVVGDRLDTDIEGAVTGRRLAAGDDRRDRRRRCRASDGQRPDYVAWTLDGLLDGHAAPEREARRGGAGRLAGRVDDGHGAWSSPTAPTTTTGLRRCRRLLGVGRGREDADDRTRSTRVGSRRPGGPT